jgi:hypothetical protein
MSERVSTVNVILVRDDVVEEVHSFNDVPEGNAEAEALFLELCAANLTNWADYSSEDVSTVVDQGYEMFGHGAIYLAHSS